MGSHRWLLAVELWAFGFFGLFWGLFAVLLSDLSRALGLSPGPLGLALFFGAVASIAAMALLGWAADSLGRRTLIALAAAVFGVGVVGLAFSGSYAALVAALVVLYAASGLYDVGINAAAVDLEQTSGRRFMPLLHAAFSAGAMLGALGAGALVEVGVGYRYVYLSILVPLAALLLAVAATKFPGSSEPTQGGREPGRHGLYGNLPLLLVAVIATLGLLSEGEMEHWSGVYLRQSLGLPALLGGSGVAVFFAAMAVGRLGTAWVVGRLGERRVLSSAGLMAAGGMALSLATREPLIVVAGFLLVGLALSAVVPSAFSLAGDAAPPGRAGAAISVVTTLGYGGFLLGPVIVGGLAELAGLRAALLTVVGTGMAIFALALRLAVSRQHSAVGKNGKHEDRR